MQSYSQYFVNLCNASHLHIYAQCIWTGLQIRILLIYKQMNNRLCPLSAYICSWVMPLFHYIFILGLCPLSVYICCGVMSLFQYIHFICKWVMFLFQYTFILGLRPLFSIYLYWGSVPLSVYICSWVMPLFQYIFILGLCPFLVYICTGVMSLFQYDWTDVMSFIMFHWWQYIQQ